MAAKPRFTQARSRRLKRFRRRTRGSRCVRKPTYRQGRLKKMMQADDDVGRIATPALDLVGRSLELFAAELVRKAAAMAANDSSAGKQALTATHIKQCVESDSLYDFLRTTVNELPAPAPKRARSASGALSAPKRSAKSGAPSSVDTATTSSSAAATVAGSADAAVAAAAEQYRPLADVDDDYDAE